MNQTDIMQIVKDNFTAFYNTNSESIETLEKVRYKYKAIREYAVSLWDVRTVDEVDRDQKAGIDVFCYMRWCREQWQLMRPLRPDELPPVREPYNETRSFVRIMAATEYDCNPGVYSGPDALCLVGKFARHLWLSRSSKAIERDRQLHTCEHDYVVWCTEEFLQKKSLYV